jgi:hypothetical protein
MKKTTMLLAAVLMAVALTGIFSKTTVLTYADDASSTDTEAKGNQKAIASGEGSAQNCEQINIDSQNTAGDEGVDCHNNQLESTEQSATD